MLNDIGGSPPGSRRASVEDVNAPNDNVPLQPQEPVENQAQGWIGWGARMVIRAVRNVVLHPWRALTVGVIASGAIFSANQLINGSGSRSQQHNLSRRSANDSSTQFTLNSTQNSLFEESNSTSATHHIPMNLNAILAAAGHLNETSANNTAVLTSMSFLDETCENGVLQDIFDEENGTNTTELINNATVWRSNNTHIRQMRLNQDQLDVALGATLINEGGCITNLSVDPGDFPNGMNVTEQQQERQAASELSDNMVECSRVAGHPLHGLDAQGQQVSAMNLNFCRETKQTHDTRTRRSADEPVASEQGVAGGANNTTNTTAVDGATANTTGITGDPAALSAAIAHIRETFCPTNITVAGNLNATASSGSTAFELLLEQIRRLCPNIEIFTTEVANLNGLFSTTEWTRFFDSYLSNITSSTLIALDTGASSNFTDLTPLTTLIDLLAAHGVSVFTANTNTPLANVPRVRSRRSAAQMLASGSSFIRNAENPAAASRLHIGAVVIGGLLLLIPGVLYGWRRRQSERSEMNSRSYDSLPQEELELKPVHEQQHHTGPFDPRRFSTGDIHMPYIDQRPGADVRSGSDWNLTNNPDYRYRDPNVEGAEERAGLLQSEDQSERQEAVRHNRNARVAFEHHLPRFSSLNELGHSISEQSERNTLTFPPFSQAQANSDSSLSNTGTFDASDPRVQIPNIPIIPPFIPQAPAVISPLPSDEARSAQRATPERMQPEQMLQQFRAGLKKTGAARAKTPSLLELHLLEQQRERIEEHKIDPENEQEIDRLQDALKTKNNTEKDQQPDSDSENSK